MELKRYYQMKRFYITSLLAVITFFACQTVSAYDFEVGGIYYNLNTSDMTATVTSGDKKYTGDVVIPSFVTYNTKTLKVTEIVSFAFSRCTSLSSITIPNSVTKIDRGAFSRCTSLPSITIPNSVITIDSEVFENCTSLTSVTIPNSVTTIGYYAFKGCTSLTSVTIPNSVTTIGECAFYCCTSLSSITIPNSVTTIDSAVFGDCTSLTSITIPNSVTVIGWHAFKGCISLSSIMIPSSVTKIDEEAFSGCISLTSITIPNSVTKIGNLAFSGCTSLSTIILPENLTQITKETFRGCSQLTSVSIPAHITDIECSAFSKCENLKELIFEDSNQSLEISISVYDGKASHLHPTYLYLGREIKDRIYGDEFMFSDKVETLVLGNTYTPKNHPDPATIKTVISKIEKPHEIDRFLNSTYASAILYVPKGTKALYESTDGWKLFFNIQEGDPTTGIVSTKNDINKVEVSRYDIKGQRLNAPRKGINIVRYSDGTTEKIVVR